MCTPIVLLRVAVASLPCERQNSSRVTWPKTGPGTCTGLCLDRPAGLEVVVVVSAEEGPTTPYGLARLMVSQGREEEE